MAYNKAQKNPTTNQITDVIVNHLLTVFVQKSSHLIT